MHEGRQFLIASIRINAYNPWVALDGDHGGLSRAERGSGESRWELYRLLADPVRIKLLALAGEEELGVGELAELLRESQPKISRHAAALREAGLLAARRQGTWTLLRLSPGAAADPVVADALGAGRSECKRDGTLSRIEEVLRGRDAFTREFFARGGRPVTSGPSSEIAAYLSALAPHLSRRRLAVDAGTGDGGLLEVLAPLFERVVAIDRSDAQLALARDRIARRGFTNVELCQGELDGDEVRRAIDRALGETCAGTPEHPAPGAALSGADVVFAARVLHHAPSPARALAALTKLAAPGGSVLVLDYDAHADDKLRDQQADLWLGFSAEDLTGFAEQAGLVDFTVAAVPPMWRGDGPDRHLDWQLLSGRRGPLSPSS